MIAPHDLTKLPDTGIFTLKTDTRVDGQDLQRFIDAGGAIAADAYKLFVNNPQPNGPSVLEMTPEGQLRTIFGWILAVPSGITIGAHPDGNGGSGIGIVLVSTSEGGSMPLKAGSVVYRVVEVDPPPDKPDLHTWKAAAIIVEKASAKQVKLKTPLPGHGGTVFKPHALGSSFFETPLQAIQHFLAARRLEIVSLDRRRKEADRAIAWATSQEGMVP